MAQGNILDLINAALAAAAATRAAMSASQLPLHLARFGLGLGVAKAIQVGWDRGINAIKAAQEFMQSQGDVTSMMLGIAGDFTAVLRFINFVFDLELLFRCLSLLVGLMLVMAARAVFGMLIALRMSGLKKDASLPFIQ